MILVDTNVVSETLRRHPDPTVIAWLIEHDRELGLPTVTIAEIAYGISKIRPSERAARLETGLQQWRRRLSGRIYAFTEDAALAFGELMGSAALHGRAMTTADGMIAATARVNGASLATRNLTDFARCGLVLISP